MPEPLEWDDAAFFTGEPTPVKATAPDWDDSEFFTGGPAPVEDNALDWDDSTFFGEQKKPLVPEGLRMPPVSLEGTGPIPDTERAPPPTDRPRLWGDVIAPGLRSTVQQTKMLGGAAADMAFQRMREAEREALPPLQMPEGLGAEQQYERGLAWAEGVKERAREALTDIPQPEVAQGDWWENLKNPETRGQQLAWMVSANIGPTLAIGASALLAGAVAGPQAAGATGLLGASLLESGASYDDLVGSGVPEDEAIATASVVGTVNGMLEMAPLARLGLKVPALRRLMGGAVADEMVRRPMLRRAVTETLKQGFWEGSTEALQEIVQNAGKRVYSENQDLFEGIGESAFVGGLIGALFGGAGTVLPQPTREETLGRALARSVEQTEFETPAEQAAITRLDPTEAQERAEQTTWDDKTFFEPTAPKIKPRLKAKLTPAEPKPAPKPQKKPRLKAKVTPTEPVEPKPEPAKAAYTVETEDWGSVPVDIERDAKGAATLTDKTGKAAPATFESEFAKDKTDEELLEFAFEPAGYKRAAPDAVPEASPARPTLSMARKTPEALQAYSEILAPRIEEGLTKFAWRKEAAEINPTTAKNADAFYDAAKAHLTSPEYTRPTKGAFLKPKKTAGEALTRALKTTRELPGKNLRKVLKKAVGAEHRELVIGPPTVEDWISRVESTLSEKEIDAAQNWYSSIGEAFEVFPKAERKRMVQAWLLSNQNVDPSQALANALRVAEQVKSGAKGKMGGLSDKTLRELFSEGKASGEGVGVKLYDFSDAALDRATRTFMGDAPSAGEPAVIDVHSGRDMGIVDEFLANYIKREFGEKVAKKIKVDLPGQRWVDSKGRKRISTSGPDERMYEAAASHLRSITKELNKRGWRGGKLTPAQVQAIGWQTMANLVSPTAAFSPKQSVEQNTRTVAFEVDFGEGAPLAEQFPEVASLPFELKQDLTQQVGEAAVKAALDITGVVKKQTTYGTGGWMESFSPSGQLQVLSSKEGVEDIADILGYLLQQTEVWVTHPRPGGESVQWEIKARTKGALSTQAKVSNFWAGLRALDDRIQGFSHTENGLRVIFPKQEGQSTKKLVQSLEDEVYPKVLHYLEKQPFDATVQRGRVELSIHGNDWSKHPDGQGYRLGLGERYGPDIQGRLDRYLRESISSQLESFLEEHEARHASRTFDRGRVPGVRSGHRERYQPPTGSDGRVRLTRWSKQPRDKIDPAYEGTGYAVGKEAARRKEPGYPARSYFGLAGYRKEVGLGPHRHTTSIPLEKLYDYRGNPDGLLKEKGEQTQYEAAIKAAGYSGYYVETPSFGPVAAVFYTLEVETKHDETGTPVPKTIPASSGLVDLEGIQVERKAQVEETGDVVSIKQDAAEAVKDIDAEIRVLNKLKDCINS